jgi:hypothetical protein
MKKEKIENTFLHILHYVRGEASLSLTITQTESMFLCGKKTNHTT